MQQSYRLGICTLSSPASSPLIEYYNNVSLPTHGGGLGSSTSAVNCGTPLQPISKGITGSSSRSGAIKLKKHSRKYVDDEKRKKFLERNRQAAVKSRQRKKQLLTDLQEKKDYLTADNEKLQVHICMLREEVMRLRRLLYTHHDCPVTKQQSSDFMPPSPASSQLPQSHNDSDYYPSYSNLLQHQPIAISIIPAGFAAGTQSESKLMMSNTLLPSTDAGQQQSTVGCRWP